ncbi:hypothetical protein Tco_1174772 [Tanacetum coccineum]
MAMTIQYGVRGMILAAQSEVFKQENVLTERLHRFRWMIYLVVLADAAESVSDAIRFEYCLASSSGWTKQMSLVLWAEIGDSSLTGPELVLDMTNKSFVVGASGYAKCVALERSNSLWSGKRIKVDKTLHFVEEPVENSDREVKRLKCSRMVVVKVHLGSKRGL